MDNIRKLAFFAELNDSDIDKLSQISMVKKYKKGSILFYEGDEAKYLHILLEGSLKIYKTNQKGQQIFLHQFVPITFVAELACFENIPYPASSEFVLDGKVLKINYQKFKEDFLSRADIAFKIIKSLTGKLKIMSQVLHQETVLTSEGKIAKFIVDNGELFSTLKHVQIASILNVTPETLSRVLSKFKTKNLISFDEKAQIVQFNKDALLKFYD